MSRVLEPKDLDAPRRVNARAASLPGAGPRAPRDDDTAPVRLLVKNYSGVRMFDRCEVVVVVFDASGVPSTNPLPRRHDLWGYALAFDWGDRGGGATQLALAMLADYFGDAELALRLHEPFRDAVVARLPRKGWSVSGEAIAAACARLA